MNLVICDIQYSTRVVFIACLCVCYIFIMVQNVHYYNRHLYNQIHLVNTIYIYILIYNIGKDFAKHPYTNL